MTERLKNKRNLQTGDIVLLKDYLHHQKYWLTKIFADKHGDIRNVKLKLASIMCTPPPLSAGGWGGVEPPTNFSKSGVLTGPQFLEEGCWETNL